MKVKIESLEKVFTFLESPLDLMCLISWVLVFLLSVWIFLLSL